MFITIDNNTMCVFINETKPRISIEIELHEECREIFFKFSGEENLYKVGHKGRIYLRKEFRKMQKIRLCYILSLSNILRYYGEFTEVFTKLQILIIL